MNAAIAWFARNPVAANLLMLLMIAIGLAAIPSVPQKPFPDIKIDVVSTSVVYLGAAPDEVEQGVCIRIEEEISSIDVVEKINTVAAEGACNVNAELISGADPNAALQDIRNRVDAITTFPDETEKPIISVVSNARPVLDVAISGPTDPRSLQAVGQRVRDELAALPDVTLVQLAIVEPFEISIEVSEDSLRRFGLTFDEVVRAVRSSSLDLPGGSIKTDGGEILLRTKGQAYRGVEFEDIVVVKRRDGTRVTLGEIATVVDGFEDLDVAGTFDGQPAVIAQVFRVGKQDVITVSNQVAEYVEQAQARMPEGITLTVWQDDSDNLRARLETLTRNGLSGFLLVLVVLALFLRPTLAFWVILAVPVSFLGAIAMFVPLELSIDVISSFAFIVVLGILVDDAIVTGESVHTYQRRGGDPLRGAIEGTQAVAVPVTFGVLTTVAAFGPMLFVEGFMGQVWRVMASVVIACLLFSLVESKLILPAHLAHGAGAERKPRSPLLRRAAALQKWFGESLERFAAERYLPALKLAIGWRYATLATATALLLVAVGVVAGGRMNFSFFPPLQADYLAARLTMPAGTPVATTAAAIQHIADASDELRRRLDPEYAPEGESLVLHVLTGVGVQPFLERSPGPGGSRGGDSGGSRAHVGEVVLELLPSEQRNITTREIGNQWREIVGTIPDAVELVYASELFSAGDAINIQLEGADVGELAEAAARLKTELANYPGVMDIGDSFRAGKQEIELAIKPSAEPLGLTLRDLGAQVRQAFYGEEAQRIQRGRDDVRVMVRYPREERRSLADLENARIRTPGGAAVPFTTVAVAELGRGYSSIRRTDRKRVVSVTADVDRKITTANVILADVLERKLPVILADYPSVNFGLEGEQREQRRAFSGLGRGYVIALFLIYALLAIPLRSYVHPLIIMSVIPFGMAGAIFGHILVGLLKTGAVMGLSFMSVVGMVALSGVVVNDSLVLVHFINSRRGEGAPLEEAVLGAGVARFRAILLTTLTTFVGLTPLILERSVQAQFLIPMAVSLAYGVAFATFVTLMVVPCAYFIQEDARAGIARLRGGIRRQLGLAEPEASEPQGPRPVSAPSKVA